MPASEGLMGTKHWVKRKMLGVDEFGFLAKSAEET
jgi:hypothetical protein